MGALEHLFGSFGVERFFAQHWAQSPVVIRGNPDHFADLFDWSGLDDYLNHRLRFFAFPALQLYSGPELGGGRVPPELFTESIRDANRCSLTVVSPEKVQRLCSEGATLMVHSVHDGDRRLKRFAAALEHALGETLRVDLFYTPPKSAGVHAHFDREDVLILQLEGEKEWHLTAPTVEWPLEPPSYAELDAAPRFPDEIQRTRRGDLMHIPRGYWHATHTSSVPSLHLSVRVACRTGVDLLRFALERLEKSVPRSRQNLPLARQRTAPYGYDPGALGTATAELSRLLLAELAAPDFVERFNDACVKSDRPAEPYQFIGASGTSQVVCQDSSEFVRPPTQRARVVARGESVVLLVWGREIEVPRSAAPALELLLARQRFTYAEVVAACPGSSLGELEALLSRLVGAGVLSLASPTVRAR